MISTALTLAAKDFRLFLRDRSGLLLTFALPIVLATIFGAAMGSMGSSEGMGRVTLLVEDLDHSTHSRALVAEFAKSAGLELKPEANVRARVANGKSAAGLLIPSGYGADLDAGREPKLVLYRDPAQTIEQQIVAGNLMPVLMRIRGPQIGRAMMKKSLAAFGMDGAATEPFEKMLADATKENESDAPAASADFMSQVPKSLGLEVEDVTGSRDSADKTAGSSHAIAGNAVMMLLFSLAACGATILEEESQGTLQRLRLTPSASRAVLLGKALFTIAVGFLQLVVLFAYGALVFGTPIGNAPLALAVVAIATAAAAAGLGLFLAVTCRTRKQLEGLSTLLILAMSALGGSWFPLVVTPAWYQKLGHFTLNAWAMDGFHSILWYGKGFDEVWIDIGVLLAIAAVLTLLALRGWRKRFEVAT